MALAVGFRLDYGKVVTADVGKGRHDLNGILEYCAFGPGMGPLFKYTVALDRICKAGDEALFRRLVMAGQQQGEEIQACHIFGEQPVEVLARCVLACLAGPSMVVA